MDGDDGRYMSMRRKGKMSAAHLEWMDPQGTRRIEEAIREELQAEREEMPQIAGYIINHSVRGPIYACPLHAEVYAQRYSLVRTGRRQSLTEWLKENPDKVKQILTTDVFGHPIQCAFCGREIKTKLRSEEEQGSSSTGEVAEALLSKARRIEALARRILERAK
jgi:hypothetical protein